MKPTKLIAILLILGIFSAGIVYCQERITIATYYPSPEGVYKNMTLYPHDDFDPAVACSQDGAMYYDDSENQAYICANSTWIPLGGGLRYLGRTGAVSASSPGLSGPDTTTVTPPAGTKYMFIADINGPVDGMCTIARARVYNQGTSSVYASVTADSLGAANCGIAAYFDCFE